MTTIGNTIPAEQLESSENLEASACAYVEKSVKPLGKAKILPEEGTAAEPQNLADAKATEKTKKVYSLLKSVADSKKILYGHQNDLHRKVSKLYSMSDTYDIVRDYPAVVGLDALALTGYELELSEEEKKRGLTLCEKMAQICLEADRQGAVLTMSCHMPNFALVAKRPKIEGKYDFSGYSPLMITGDVAARILPGEISMRFILPIFRWWQSCWKSLRSRMYRWYSGRCMKIPATGSGGEQSPARRSSSVSFSAIR